MFPTCFNTFLINTSLKQKKYFEVTVKKVSGSKLKHYFVVWSVSINLSINLEISKMEFLLLLKEPLNKFPMKFQAGYVMLIDWINHCLISIELII